MVYLRSATSGKPTVIQSLLRQGHFPGWDDPRFVPNEYSNYKIFDHGELIVRDDLLREIHSLLPGPEYQSEKTNYAIKIDPENYPRRFERMVGKDDYDHIIFGEILPRYHPSHSYSRLKTSIFEDGQLDNFESQTIYLRTFNCVSNLEVIPSVPRELVEQSHLICIKNSNCQNGYFVSDELFRILRPYFDPPYWLAFDIEADSQIMGPTEEEVREFVLPRPTIFDQLMGTLDSLLTRIQWVCAGIMFMVLSDEQLRAIRAKNAKNWKREPDPISKRDDRASLEAKEK